MTEENNVTAEQAGVMATDTRQVIEKALAAAISANLPGYGYIGLLVATRALRAALLKEQILDEETVAGAEELAQALFETPAPFIQLASRHISRRTTCASAPLDLREQITGWATECLQKANSFTSDLIAMLLILDIARQMALTALKHMYPSNFEDQLDTLAAMKNGFDLDKMRVAYSAPMGKGGDA